MSKAQNCPPANNAERKPPEPGTDHVSRLVAGAAVERRDAFGTNDCADLGGHTLLSHTPPPQGRRSLFRR